MHKVKYFPLCIIFQTGSRRHEAFRAVYTCTRGQKYAATLSKMSGTFWSVINVLAIFIPSSRYGIASLVVSNEFTEYAHVSRKYLLNLL